MSIINKRFLNLSVRLIALLSFVALLVISVAVYRMDLLSLLVFMLFLLFYVQIPGFAISKLLKMDFNHISTEIIVSFFNGWISIILLYFVSELINSNILLYFVNPILAVFYIYSKIKNGNLRSLKTRISFSKISNCYIVFAILILAYALLHTQFKYVAPAYSDFAYMNTDKAYHMGLINALSHRFPLESPWVQGRIIKYHIFTEILLSVPVRLFGLASDAVYLSFNPFMTSYVFSLSTYSLMKEMCKRKNRAGVYSLVVLLSNIFLCRGITNSIAFKFAIINDNASGYGVASCMILVILIKYWFDRNCTFIKNPGFLCALVAASMLVTGIKGPMGAVMIGAVWGTYILGLILKKVRFADIIPILCMTAGFLLVYATILGLKGQSNGDGTSLIAIATITNITFWKPALIAALDSIGVPKIIKVSIILCVFMVFFLTIYFIPFCIGYIREFFLIVTKRKDFDFSKIVVYAAAFVGIAMLLLLNYSGHSQIYFGLVSVFFVPLISYWFFEEVECLGSGKLFKITRRIFAILLIFTTIGLSAQYIRCINSAVAFSDPHRKYAYYTSVSNEEYQAMEWIRKNTPEDSLLATDRYYSVSLDKYSYENRWANRFFLYAVYSNRFCYIAGSGYNLPAGDWVIRKEMVETNNKLYDPNNSDRGELARSLGIDYVIVSKRFTKLPSLENEDYKLCFSNNDVDVYEVINH